MRSRAGAGLSIFVDFDTVVSSRPVGAHVLDRATSGEWRAGTSRAIQDGWIGGRLVIEQLWALVPHDLAWLSALASEVPVDPAFARVVEAARAAGGEVVVVSDGFGFYVARACEPFGVSVLANEVDPRAGELAYPYLDRCCSCITCGMCKQAPIKDAKGQGRTTVFASGAASDRKAALLADVLFARGSLASWCSDFGVPFRPLDSLADLAAAVRELAWGDEGEAGGA